MRIWFRALPVVIGATVFLGDIKIPTSDGQGVQLTFGAATAEARFSLRRTLRKIGSGLKKVVKKAGEGVKKAVKKVGEGVKKVGKSIGKAFKSIGDFAKKIKDKVVAKMMGFVTKMLGRAKGFIDGILDKLIGAIANKVGLTVDDIHRIVDLQTGKINMDEVKKLIVGKVSQRVGDFVEGKVRIVVDKLFGWIRPVLDSAVSVIVGAVGSIPFAGGAIAAAVSAAYSFGMVKLRDAAVSAVTKLVDKLVSDLLGRSFDFLVQRIAPLRNAVDKIVAQATKIYGMLGQAQKRAGAIGGR